MPSFLLHSCISSRLNLVCAVSRMEHSKCTALVYFRLWPNCNTPSQRQRRSNASIRRSHAKRSASSPPIKTHTSTRIHSKRQKIECGNESHRTIANNIHSNHNFIIFFFRLYAESIQRPFGVRYNPYTQSVEVLSSAKRITAVVSELRGDLSIVSSALKKVSALDHDLDVEKIAQMLQSGLPVSQFFAVNVWFSTISDYIHISFKQSNVFPLQILGMRSQSNQSRLIGQFAGDKTQGQGRSGQIRANLQTKWNMIINQWNKKKYNFKSILGGAEARLRKNHYRCIGIN